MGEFSDKVCLVTGGASGIGRATCQLFAEKGASVVVADIDANGGQKTARELGSQARFLSLDVTSESEWENAVSMAIERFGRLDVLVNSAGIGINGNFEETSLEDWKRVLEVNLTGTFLGCKHGIRGIKQSDGGGALVNMSSMAGIVGGDDIAAYSASKGGVTLLTKSVALHCAKYNLRIRCNAVCPTYVDSEMLDPVAEQLGGRDIMRAGMAELVPLGRLALPEDIANVIMFLASPGAAMITGAAIMVDGGQTAGVPGRHAED